MGGDRGSLSDVRVARELAELAEDELSAIDAGDLDLLEELATRRAPLLGQLSAHPPATARDELEAARAAQAAVTAALGRLRDEVAVELRGLDGKRRAAGGYARAAGASSRGGGLDAAG